MSCVDGFSVWPPSTMASTPSALKISTNPLPATTATMPTPLARGGLAAAEASPSRMRRCWLDMSPTLSFSSLPYSPATLITRVGSSVCTCTFTSSGSPTTSTELPSDSMWLRILSSSSACPSMRNSVQYPQPPSGRSIETCAAAFTLVGMGTMTSASSMVLSIPSRMICSPKPPASTTPASRRICSWLGVLSTAERAPAAAAAITLVALASGSTARAKPRKIWERITPELPRAPMRLPCEASRAILLTSVAFDSLMSSTADCNVSSMLVPVSPSGTGNTLSRLTSSWLAASQFRLPSRACLKSGPSTLDGRFAPPNLTPFFPDALDVDVDLHDRHLDGSFDGKLHSLLEVVRDLSDSDAVLDDHIHVDRQPAIDLGDLDASIDALAVQQLREPVPHAPCRHAGDAVAAQRGVPGDRRHRGRKDLDPSPRLRVAKRGRRFRGHERQMVQLRPAGDRCGRQGDLPPPEGFSWPNAARSAARSRNTDTT